MATITLLNQKGGVGKTSTCHHLAGTLAQLGRRPDTRAAQDGAGERFGAAACRHSRGNHHPAAALSCHARGWPTTMGTRNAGASDDDAGATAPFSLGATP